MPTERCDAAQNRRRILEVAKALFAVGRLDNTSMQEIARTAGVGQGTLYRRFADKGELCEALFADDLEVFRAEADAYLKTQARDTLALPRLAWLLEAKIRFVDAHLSLFLASHEVAGSKRHDTFKKSHHLWNRERVTDCLAKRRPTVRPRSATWPLSPTPEWRRSRRTCWPTSGGSWGTAWSA